METDVSGEFHKLGSKYPVHRYHKRDIFAETYIGIKRTMLQIETSQGYSSQIMTKLNAM